MRLAHTQVCPAFRYLDAMAPLTAISISASSKTMNGALPPSSSEIFLTVPAHCCISNLPTSVDMRAIEKVEAHIADAVKKGRQGGHRRQAQRLRQQLLRADRAGRRDDRYRDHQGGNLWAGGAALPLQ